MKRGLTTARYNVLLHRIMKGSILLLVLLAAVGLSSCALFKEPPTEFPTAQILPFAEAPVQLDGLSGSFHQNVAYGPYPEQVFDIFLPESTTPTPLVIYIHGGGFIRGNKSVAYRDVDRAIADADADIKRLLENGVAFATIDYRLLVRRDKEGVLKCMNDSKRCLQYIRAHADAYNIDEDNIVLSGSSAGAGTALWIGLSDDMANADATDELDKQSTRVKGIAVKATQSTYDVERWAKEVLAEYNPKDKKMEKAFVKNPFVRMYMFRLAKSFNAIKRKRDFYAEPCQAYRKSIDYLSFMSPDDPPLWIDNTHTPYEEPYSIDVLFHHSDHAQALKEQADKLGVPAVAYYHNYADASNEDMISFMLRMVGR